LFDELVVDVGPIREEYIGNRAPVLVFAMGLERDFLAEDQLRNGSLGSLALGLTFLRTVNPVQADAFSSFVVQDFDGVAVEDGEYVATHRESWIGM